MFIGVHQRPDSDLVPLSRNASQGHCSAAERFGFKTKDLAGTQFSTWRKIAIEAKAEVWSADVDDALMQWSRFVPAILLLMTTFGALWIAW